MSSKFSKLHGVLENRLLTVHTLKCVEYNKCRNSFSQKKMHLIKLF